MKDALRQSEFPLLLARYGTIPRCKQCGWIQGTGRVEIPTSADHKQQSSPTCPTNSLQTEPIHITNMITPAFHILTYCQVNSHSKARAATPPPPPPPPSLPKLWKTGAGADHALYSRRHPVIPRISLNRRCLRSHS